MTRLVERQMFLSSPESADEFFVGLGLTETRAVEGEVRGVIVEADREHHTVLFENGDTRRINYTVKDAETGEWVDVEVERLRQEVGL